MKNWYEIKAQADSADIVIYDEIGAWGVTAKDFIADLKKQSGKSITCSINSPGGNMFDGIAMYNALRAHGAPITTKVIGVAASAASFIFMAGDVRVMPENTFLMIHNPMGMACGNAEEMRGMADALDKFAVSLVNIYSARSGKTEDEIKAMLDAETWLNAADALEGGFATQVESEMKVAACFETDRLPENIQEMFKNAVVQTTVTTTTWTEEDQPEDNKPEDAPTAFADSVVSALKSTGLDAYAAEFVLTVSDKADLDAAITNAIEVKALCAVAGKPEESDKYIRARTSVADVRAALLNGLVAQDETNQTDGSQPSASTQQTEKPTAGVKTAEIWASRRHH